MNKTIGSLSLLLIAQILLAGALLFSGPDLAAVRPDTPLIDLEGQTVDRLVIEGTENETVTLEKKAHGWVLPDHFGFPAEKGKVDRLLDQLRALRHGFPVATTHSALTRFQLTDESFERRITLAHGGRTLSKIYLGSSPGVRRIHARTAEDEGVYSVDFSAYQAPAAAQDWEDKEVIRFPQEEIEEIQLIDLTIRRNPVPPPEAQPPEETPADSATPPDSASKEEKAGAPPEEPTPPPPVWVAHGLAPGERLDEEAVSKLARLLSDLRIARVMGLQEQVEYGLDEPRLNLGYTRRNAETEDTSTVAYTLGRSGADDAPFVLKTSHRPEYFELYQYTGEPLVEAAARDKLVIVEEKDERDEEESAEAAEEGPGEEESRETD
uniref:DUF4340 domain-containing protein n=1 Tax=Candidatus Kentrum sp. FM TaxID=2126340 RepID=A0A450RUW0_9GAMM|nr:MAG: protein of unknown function (DUF4340) [Candidatus Kentron sp. FM]VFJ43552.1 MAG: protein of unknown function (DUF4340) [Candidatus Kentron sp. FM]VFK05596.1 MAG: protein of unknown function (DUF4340) [Candidatus Kentron sp. FM]